MLPARLAHFTGTAAWLASNLPVGPVGCHSEICAAAVRSQISPVWLLLLPAGEVLMDSQPQVAQHYLRGDFAGEPVNPTCAHPLYGLPLSLLFGRYRSSGSRHWAVACDHAMRNCFLSLS